MSSTAETVSPLRRFLTKPATIASIAVLVIAALSLLYPSTPSYDQWAWIVWGREIIQFDLQTTGGPSWKPLPMLFTVPFALFGGAAPDLWLVLARAGALMSFLLAFVLAGRLCEAAWRESDAPRRSWVAVVAGTVAVGMVLLQVGYLRYAAYGESEGLVNAAGFAAILWHLDRKYKAALIAASAVALMRPEMWPFLGAYGLWLWFARPEVRRWLVGCGVAIPVLWFLPEYIGSGDFFRAASRAKQPSLNSPAFADIPFIQTIDNGAKIIPHVLQPLILLPLPFIAWAASRRRWTPLVLFMLATLWIVLVAGMTQAGFAGNRRYLLLATSLLCVLAGFGVGSVLVLVRKAAAALNPKLVPAATAVFVLLTGVVAVTNLTEARLKPYKRLEVALKRDADRRSQLWVAVGLAGGRDRVIECGTVTTERYQVPRLAWVLNVHTLDVEGRPVDSTGAQRAPTPGTAFQTASPRSDGPRPLPPFGSRELGEVGPWKVFQVCADGKPSQPVGEALPRPG